jgi:hypothetical protein
MRDEQPLDPELPYAEFASELRALRRREPRLTYREMARLTHYGTTVLCVAASGRRLPTWSVTHAYVSVCGGSVAEWHRRWTEARKAAVRGRRKGRPRG